MITMQQFRTYYAQQMMFERLQGARKHDAICRKCEFVDRFHQLSTLFRQHHTTAKLHLYYSIYIAHDRVPTVMEKHRKNLVMEKSLKMGKKIKVMEILKKSWNFFTADHESRTRSSDNSIYRSTVVIWIWEAFGLCSRFPICNVRWEANHFFDSLFSVSKEI